MIPATGSHTVIPVHSFIHVSHVGERACRAALVPEGFALEGLDLIGCSCAKKNEASERRASLHKKNKSLTVAAGA